MDNYEIIPVDESFNNRMLSIMAKSPINSGGLRIRFDKSPDLFAISRMRYSDCRHLGFFLEGELKGFASLGFYDAYVSKVKERVFTFYNFYLLPEARGRRLSELAMRDFFSEVRGKANYGISVTMKGNRPAESYIGLRNRSWMPPSRTIGELVIKSMIFSLPAVNRTGFSVRNAVTEDIPSIVNLLDREHSQRDFGNVYDIAGFEAGMAARDLTIEDYYVALDRRGVIKGVCLAWDCTRFRRTRVLHFNVSFYPLLLMYRTLEKVMKLAPFPSEGGSFSELTITDYATGERDVSVMHALLCEIYRRHLNGRYHLMNFGSCKGDPLLNAAKGFLHRNICSHIAFTSLDPERYSLDARLPYIDISFL